MGTASPKIARSYRSAQLGGSPDRQADTGEGKVERKTVSISLVKSEGSAEAKRWHLHDAWPSEWQGADLNAAERGTAIEALTLAFDRIKIT